MKKLFKNSRLKKNFLEFIIISIMSIALLISNIGIYNIFIYNGQKNNFNTNIDIPKLYGSTDLIEEAFSDSKSQNNVKKDNTKDKNKQEQNIKQNLDKAEENIKMIPELTDSKLNKVKDDAQKKLEKYGKFKKAAVIETILKGLAFISTVVVIFVFIITFVLDKLKNKETKQLYSTTRTLRMHTLTFFLICQLLPLIYALIVKGWVK